jgi:hypothetical protein
LYNDCSHFIPSDDDEKETILRTSKRRKKRRASTYIYVCIIVVTGFRSVIKVQYWHWQYSSNTYIICKILCGIQRRLSLIIVMRSWQILEHEGLRKDFSIKSHFSFGFLITFFFSREKTRSLLVNVFRTRRSNIPLGSNEVDWFLIISIFIFCALNRQTWLVNNLVFRLLN